MTLPPPEDTDGSGARPKANSFECSGKGTLSQAKVNITPPRKLRYPWYDTYMSALFECDAVILEHRILQAERELVARERSLFNAPKSSSERTAVIAALRALAALRQCNGLQTDAAEAASA